MRRQLTSISLLILLSTVPAAAAEPRLVADINPYVQSSNSGPVRFFTLGDVGLFLAQDEESGYELWRSDGTAAGTYLVQDQCEGSCGIEISSATAAGNRAFYHARDGQNGAALWVTGGTPATTFRLASTDLTSLYHQPIWAGRIGLYFFFGYDAEHGNALWRSDGTPAGTYRLIDLAPDSFSSRTGQLIEFKGRVFFSADDGNGPSLWSSDGTRAGTRLVRDPKPGSASHTGPERLTVAGNFLVFFAPAANRGLELWRSDGTIRGTSLLKDLKPGAASPEILDIRGLGRRAFFIADTGHGQELWVTDGTAEGTRELTQLPRKDSFFGDLALTSYFLTLPKATLPNGRMVFAVNDGPHGIEPWITDGTPAGTRLLREVCPGACSMTEFAEEVFLLAQGRLWFFGDDGIHGDELWSTDGTKDGTRLVQDVCPGRCNSYALPFATLKNRLLFIVVSNGRPGELELWQAGAGGRGATRLTGTEHFLPLGDIEGAVLPDIFLFSASDTDHGIELWKTDGTRAGTELVRDIAGTDLGGSSPRDFLSAGGKLYFFADDGVHGVEPWTSDGTSAGTHLVHDLDPDDPFPDILDPQPWAELNGSLLFFRPHGNRFLLWRTDGSEAGTFPLVPEDLLVRREGIHVLGNNAYFVADDGVQAELWKTDGTPEGTSRVGRLFTDSSALEPKELTVFGGNLFFIGFVEGIGTGLWKSDGTPAGTKRAHENLGRADHILGVHGGRLYFTAETPGQGMEPWSTDGTPAGARQLIDLNPGPNSAPVDRVVSLGGRMLLLGAGGSGLWSSNGTAGGTLPLDSPTVARSPLAVFGGALYYTLVNQTLPGALWRSDGTEAGTAPFLDPSGQQIIPDDLEVCGSHLYFQRTGVLWRTDGTPAGTEEVPGAPPVGEMRRVGSRLFFQGYDPDTGFELWVLDGC